MKPPKEERLVYWVGKACRQYREEAGLYASTIAGLVPCVESTIYRFETGESWPTGKGVDHVLQIYVEQCGIGNEINLLKRAIDLMEENATPAEASEDDLPADPLLEDKTQPNRRTADKAPKRQAKRRRPA